MRSDILLRGVVLLRYCTTAVVCRTGGAVLGGGRRVVVLVVVVEVLVVGDGVNSCDGFMFANNRK